MFPPRPVFDDNPKVQWSGLLPFKETGTTRDTKEITKETIRAATTKETIRATRATTITTTTTTTTSKDLTSIKLNLAIILDLALAPALFTMDVGVELFAVEDSEAPTQINDPTDGTIAEDIKDMIRD
ncbi:hypothetical protein BGZ81_008054 [Podila clonocystis]|nr:hypothetical protein BGZ81_008054 [Podila clonocystis]